MSAARNSSNRDREWGDFQTPVNLTEKICSYLSKSGIAPKTIIEPTFGVGNFICTALKYFQQVDLVYGVEIKTEYHEVLHKKLSQLESKELPKVELYQDNIFQHKFQVEKIIGRGQELLILGNPPWVTNAELGSIASENLPIKSNFKASNGLDAITGKANFDTAEWIILKLLELFAETKGTLAVLCKTSVIRSILQHLKRFNLKTSNFRALKIDAKAEFGADVDSALFVADLGQAYGPYVCKVSNLDYPDLFTSSFGWEGDEFVSDITAYAKTNSIKGTSPFVWRQGVKHDCAKVMELEQVGNKLYNGFGEQVEIETQYVYPLVKSSDLKQFEIKAARKQIIITQSKPGENTQVISSLAPKLWNYLTRNSQYLDQRKSSIYRNQPHFAIFGIGEYSFKPYKVAISGLYKQPCFCLIQPYQNRPVMLDDTCYFLGFDSYLPALFTNTMLNSNIVQQFLASVAFLDAKRPYTKDVLMRIDLRKVADKLSFEDICSIWASQNYRPNCPVTAANYSNFVTNLNQKNNLLVQTELALQL